MVFIEVCEKIVKGHIGGKVDLLLEKVHFIMLAVLDYNIRQYLLFVAVYAV